MAERIYIVQPGQCLEDVALQEYGGQDGIRHLLFDNLDVLVDGFCTDLYGGMELRIANPPVNQPLYDAIKKLGLVFATTDDEQTTPIGTLGDYLPADFNNDHFITP